MKANPLGLIKAHYSTLRDYRTGAPRWQDYAFFLGPSVLVFTGCWLLGTELPHGASAGLLTTSGVLTAFFFGVMLQVAQRAMDWADRVPTPGEETSWQARFLGEIAANAGYASLVSIVAAGVFVGTLIAKHTALVVLSSLGLALLVHLGLMLAMVLTRIYSLTTDRLTSASVGGPTGNVTQLYERKANSGS